MEIKSKCGKYGIQIDKDDHQKVMDFSPNGWEVKFFNKNQITRMLLQEKLLMVKENNFTYID